MLSLSIQTTSFLEAFSTFCRELDGLFGPSEAVLVSGNSIFYSDGKHTKPVSEIPASPHLKTYDLSVGGSKIGQILYRGSESKKDELILDALIEKLGCSLEAVRLREEKAFLELVLDNMSEAIVACDENGVLKLFNRKTRELHGLPQESIPPESWADNYDLFDKDGKTPLNQNDIPLYRAFQGEKVKNSTFVIRRKDSGPLNIISHGGPLTDEKGNKIGAMVTMRDETDLSFQLHRAELRFRTLFEQAPLSIQICSRDGRTLLVNPAWKRLWGISEDVINNFILKDYNLLTDPMLEQQDVLKYIREGFEGKITHVPVIEYDAQQNQLDGHFRMVEGLIYPLKDPSGKVTEIVIVHTDVTPTKVIEKRQNFLAKLTSILITTLDHRQMISQIADACLSDMADGCMIDLVEDGQIRRLVTRHKDHRKQMLLDELQKKYPPAADSPQPSPRVIRTGEPEFLKVVDQTVIAAHTYNPEHLKLITEIGIRSHIAVPIKTKGKIRGSICLFYTGDKRYSEEDMETAEEVARRAGLAIENSQLYQNAQLAVQKRDEFISIASHELKTPITSMKLQLQLAGKIISDSTDGLTPAASMQRIADTTIRQIDRITVLVDDMLDIARINTGKLGINLQPTNVSTIARDVVGRLRHELKGPESLLTEKIQDNVKGMCDGFRIEQVLTNIIINAIRYGNRKPIEVAVEKSGNHIILKVTDHGPGIAPEDQERIFQRFERAGQSQEYSGMGLGLFISRQIIEQHNGTLTVQSEPGKGSTFTAIFPG